MIGILFKGEIIKPAHAVYNMTTEFKLVHDYHDRLHENQQKIIDRQSEIGALIRKFCS